MACMRTGDPRVCDLIHRDATGSLWLTPDGYIDQINQNAGELHSRGVDVNASYVLAVGSDSFLNLNLFGSYLLAIGFSNPVFGYDCTGYFGGSCGQPNSRWRHRFTASWETGFHAVFTLGWRLTGPVTNSVASTDPDLGYPPAIPYHEASGDLEIGTYSFFDLAATYDITSHVQLTVGVNNVLDKEPPLGAGSAVNDYGPGFYGTYDPYGRFLHASLLFTF